MPITMDDKNKIYQLLKDVTAIIEDVQSRCAYDPEGDDAYNRLSVIITVVDGLYCDVADLD